MKREIYAHAPVVLVAIEARHPDADPLTAGEQSELKRLLASNFPLSQPSVTVMVAAGPEGAAQTQEEMPRFVTRDQTTAVTFARQSTVVESAAHKSFDDLAELLRLVVNARQQVAPVSGLLRLGLRYIDEIRVPDLPDGVLSWGEWVDPTLLGPVALGAALDLTPTQAQGAVVFDRGDGRQMLVRYGPRDGYAVMPGVLQRPTPPPGPFFLLDIDSFWAPTPGADVPEFTPESIVDKSRDLHEPVSALFERFITERLREEVLR